MGLNLKDGSRPLNVYLDVRSLLLMPKGQAAQEVEESTDLLGCEVVHVI